MRLKMKRISDPTMLDFYIKKYELNSIFQDPMTEYMELLRFSKGELICSKGNKMNYVYFIVEGKVKIYILQEDGKLVLLRFNRPLSILGDVEFIKDSNIQCNVESLNETLLIGIPMEAARKHAYNDPEFLRFIIKNLSHKLYTTSNTVSLNLLYPLESRLASYLLSMKDDEGHILNSDDIKTTRLVELANLLGTSYRHLNRVVNELVSRDIIERKKGVIAIKNLEKLQELSKGNLYE
jgi:CRP/FNR family transcriptional regulator, putaive post-exponential-phase nitrogen-starvation regulator